MQSAPQAHNHVFLGERHEANERKTWAVIILCGLMMLVEIIGGALFNSLALIADGLHMSTHAGAMLIAALAYTYARRHATDNRFVFGTGKLGDLAGFTSAIVLALIALLIGYEAIERFMSPVPISFNEAIPIAVLGLVVNIVSAWLLSGDHHGHSHGGHSHGGHSHGGHSAGGHSHGGHSHGGHSHGGHSNGGHSHGPHTHRDDSGGGYGAASGHTQAEHLGHSHDSSAYDVGEARYTVAPSATRATPFAPRAPQDHSGHVHAHDFGGHSHDHDQDHDGHAHYPASHSHDHDGDQVYDSDGQLHPPGDDGSPAHGAVSNYAAAGRGYGVDSNHDSAGHAHDSAGRLPDHRDDGPAFGVDSDPAAAGHAHGVDSSRDSVGHGHHADGTAGTPAQATIRDNSIRSAYVHVLADAFVSVLAITGLILAKLYGWLWMDPLAGIIGAVVIANWSVTLIRDTAGVLLDVCPDEVTRERVRRAIETDGDRVVDLHLWRLGPGHLAAVLAIATARPRDASFYRSRLAAFACLSHITVEVTRADNS